MSIKSDKFIIQKSTLPTHYTPGDVVTAALDFAWSDLDMIPDGVMRDGRNWYPVGERELHEFKRVNPWFPMIAPFEAGQVRGTEDNKKISYGTSSYGYDVRCTDKFKIFTNINNSMVDPKAFDPNCFVDYQGDVCIIPPNSFALASTVEWFKIPRNVLTICLGKSTYARCGIIVNVTPLEPEWEGHVTLEFSNTTNLPAKIYANEGVAQMLFLESDEQCLTSYKDRGGKYQGQSGVTLPRG
jgi:dCTP deaminase